jgi:hypothetical protein
MQILYAATPSSVNGIKFPADGKRSLGQVLRIKKDPTFAVGSERGWAGIVRRYLPFGKRVALTTQEKGTDQ